LRTCEQAGGQSDRIALRRSSAAAAATKASSFLTIPAFLLFLPPCSSLPLSACRSRTCPTAAAAPPSAATLA
jgi:hypothetical protein